VLNIHNQPQHNHQPVTRLQAAQPRLIRHQQLATQIPLQAALLSKAITHHNQLATQAILRAILQAVLLSKDITHHSHLTTQAILSTKATHRCKDIPNHKDTLSLKCKDILNKTCISRIATATELAAQDLIATWVEATWAEATGAITAATEALHVLKLMATAAGAAVAKATLETAAADKAAQGHGIAAPTHPKIPSNQKDKAINPC